MSLGGTTDRLRSAFTLIEMLIVLTIGGVLLVAATTLLVNMTILRAYPDDGLKFDLHNTNLQRFLQSAVNGETVPFELSETASTTIDDEAEDSEPSDPNSETEADPETETTPPVVWAWLPEESESESPHLECILSGQLPIFEGATEMNRKLPTQLHFSEDNGLFLVWYYKERDSYDDDFIVYQKLLSPYVTALNYVYYDEDFENWEFEDEPLKEPGSSEYPLPDFIQLALQDPNTGAEQTIQILLPNTESVVPHP